MPPYRQILPNPPPTATPPTTMDLHAGAILGPNGPLVLLPNNPPLPIFFASFIESVVEFFEDSAQQICIIQQHMNTLTRGYTDECRHMNEHQLIWYGTTNVERLDIALAMPACDECQYQLWIYVMNDIITSAVKVLDEVGHTIPPRFWPLVTYVMGVMGVEWRLEDG